MERRLSYGISLYLVEMVILTSRAIYVNECRLCKPGFYASRMCSETHDTVCKPCSSGTFSAKPNVLRQCPPCSNCNAGKFAFEVCSKSIDTVCVPCSSFKSNLSGNFVRDCRQHQFRQIIHNAYNSYDAIDYNRHKGNNEESSGASDNNNNNMYIVNDGSGQIIEEDDVMNVTSTEEGSGFISEIDDIHDSNATSAIPILLSEDVNEVKKNAEEITTLATTTVKTKNIDEDNKRDIFKNNKINEDNPEVILNTQVQLATTTTTIVTTMDKSGPIHVSQPGSSEEIDDIENERNQRYQYTGPHTSESQEKGASIGIVVVAWLVAAVTFFILGFIANKCWSGRRERTFNVEEAERQNRKNQITFYTIEYRDDENSEPKNYYDKISGAVTGSASEMLSANDIKMVDVLDQVNSKPIQRNITHVSNDASTPPVAEKANGVSQQPRPKTEIEYSDGDAVGVASHALLSWPRPVGESIDESSPTSSKTSNLKTCNDLDMKDGQEIDNDSMPMLAQISESHARWNNC